MSESNSITQQIARFAIDTHGELLPESALHVVRLSMLDWMAVARAGKDEPVSQIVRSLVVEEGGREEAFAIGLNHHLPARAAALLNGTVSHALDYDDTHFASMGHPSVAVVPAALAIAQRTGANAVTLQQAVLIGVEITVRIGMWLGREHYRSGFHITATAGTFGAAMTAARLLNLNMEQTCHALGLAASRAAGVKEQFGSMGKPYHAGLAASNGVEAALLAHRGFIAADCALEGVQGFAKSHHGEFNSHAFDRLGEEYLFEQVSHKFHACCHGIHAALEALIDLRDKHSIKPDDIVDLQITVHPQYLDICNITKPSTGLQCKFSYRMAASMLMHEYDTAKLDIYNDTLCKDAALMALRDRVGVEVDAAVAESAAVVRITLSNQTILHANHDLLAPVEPAEREQKILNKASSLIGEADCQLLWGALQDVVELPLQQIFNRSLPGKV